MAKTLKDRAETRPLKTGHEEKATQVTAKRAASPVASSEAPPKAKKAGSSTTRASAQPVTAEERWNMIATAAYYRAEKRGFLGGHPAEDWAAAEAEVDAQLAGRKKQPSP